MTERDYSDATASELHADRYGAPLPPEVLALSREEIVGFLCKNDPNGCYSDEDSLSEGFDPFTLESARQFLMAQHEETEEGDTSVLEWIVAQLGGSR